MSATVQNFKTDKKKSSVISALTIENKQNEPELLLQLANDSVLNLVKILQLAERNEDDDSLAATIKVELLSSGYVRAVQVGLQLRSRSLQQIRSN